MRIAPGLLDQIVSHALRDAPDECCGVVAAVAGEAAAVHELVNVRASPQSFELGADFASLVFELEDRGQQIGAIYHSHTGSEPYPSQTDVNYATKQWTGVEWLIVGLAGDEPLTRSFLIDEGVVTEVALEVV